MMWPIHLSIRPKPSRVPPHLQNFTRPGNLLEPLAAQEAAKIKECLLFLLLRYCSSTEEAEDEEKHGKTVKV